MAADRTDVLFEGLMVEAKNPRLKASLKRVKEACDFLEASSGAITPTSVGRFCETKWGGPKAQSIRNQPDILLRYIDTRKGQQKLPMEKGNRVSEPVIHDETVRAYVSLLRAERDEAVRNTSRIIQGLRKIPGIPIDELIGNGFKPIPADTKPLMNAISSNAASALTKLLNDTHLAKTGLELRKDRLRNSLTGEVLLEKSEVEALRELSQSSLLDQTPLPMTEFTKALK